jgi:hypothetical protein
VYARAVFWEEREGERTLSVGQFDAGTVRALVGALDGEWRSLVIIEGPGAQLAIGGSAATGLVVSLTVGDDDHRLLVGHGARQGEQVVVAGGQPGRYPCRCIIGADEAVAVAAGFAESGVLPGDGRWER